jgi:hypothetical protein
VRPMVDSSTNWRCCFWGGKCEVTRVVFPSWHCFLHCSGYSNMQPKHWQCLTREFWCFVPRWCSAFSNSFQEVPRSLNYE